MLIAQISDTHVSVDLPEGVRRLDDLRRTVTAINALEPQPDVVIHTGDLANRGREEEYEAAGSALAALRAPFYPVPGNRDDRARLRARFIRWPCLVDGAPFVQYAVDSYPVRLLALDSQSGHSQKGDWCDVRAGALARALVACPQRPTAVFVHHPPFEVEGDPESFQFDTREGASRLAAALTSARQVLRLFCGHAHRAREVRLEGIVASTMESIAVDLRQGDARHRESRAPRFQLHRYEASTGFTTRHLDAG